MRDIDMLDLRWHKGEPTWDMIDQLIDMLDDRLTSERLQEVIDETYQDGLDAGYEDGYSEGYEDGKGAASDRRTD